MLSAFLFLLVISWIIRTSTSGKNNGIQWTLLTQFNNLGFVDGMGLLSHKYSQMQEKKQRAIATTSAGTVLKLNLKKIELTKINTTAQRHNL